MHHYCCCWWKIICCSVLHAEVSKKDTLWNRCSFCTWTQCSESETCLICRTIDTHAYTPHYVWKCALWFRVQRHDCVCVLLHKNWTLPDVTEHTVTGEIRCVFCLSLPGLLLLSGGCHGCQVGFESSKSGCIGKKHFLCFCNESHIHTLMNSCVSAPVFLSNLYLSLSDENECEMTPNLCGNHSLCMNTNGSYYCNCVKGFQSKTPNFTAITGQCEGMTAHNTTWWNITVY